MKNLSNNFLIPMPHVNDPIFKKSLIYICSHDKSGAMGLIINKKINELDLKQETNEILKQTKSLLPLHLRKQQLSLRLQKIVRLPNQYLQMKEVPYRLATI